MSAAPKASPAPALLSVRNLVKEFPVHGGILSRVVAQVRAVQDVSFDIGRGQVLGLVGESGSGKTTVGRSILRLIEPTAGEVVYDGVGHHDARPGGHAPVPAAHADRLPGSVREPQPAHDRG